jgi:16S rRNA (cytidine1402-2'-O)-methyltransferase
VSCGLTLEHGWSRTDTVSGWKAAPTTLAVDTPAVFSLLA